MKTFGPVPSRRLGRSIGINNLFRKQCTYSCVYCQLGPTHHRIINRRPFYAPRVLQQDLIERVTHTKKQGETIDALTFVPNGEPTLDICLKKEIESARQLGIKTAVISNGSLLWQKEVRNALNEADWVSVKVDTIQSKKWQQINRPHPVLRMDEVLYGILLFAEHFQGDLVTETMLVSGINDDEAHLLELSEFIARLQPLQACLLTPIRPPAEPWVKIPGKESENRARLIFKERLKNTGCFYDAEDNDFSYTGNLEEDLLRIASVHPMRRVVLNRLLEKAGGSWKTVEKLIHDKKLQKTEYEGVTFYSKKAEN